jgi:hypothetical protein
MYFNNKRLTIVIFLIFYLSITIGCIKDKNETRPCFQLIYYFQVDAQWSAQKTTYLIGDTITLTSRFEKILPDQNGTLRDYTNSLGIGGDMSVILLDSVNRAVVPAKDSFVFISKIGAFVERGFNKNSGINTKYIETANAYEFECSVICTKKGIYGFGLPSLLTIGLPSKNCTNASFAVTVTNTDKNKSLYLNAMGVTLTEQDWKAGYCFRVF